MLLSKSFFLQIHVLLSKWDKCEIFVCTWWYCLTVDKYNLEGKLCSRRTISWTPRLHPSLKSWTKQMNLRSAHSLTVVSVQLYTTLVVNNLKINCWSNHNLTKHESVTMICYCRMTIDNLLNYTLKHSTKQKNKF